MLVLSIGFSVMRASFAMNFKALLMVNKAIAAFHPVRQSVLFIFEMIGDKFNFLLSFALEICL